ncbi:MAG: N-acetylneuraminate synthase family protein [Vicinamibacterales bacterium]
MLREIGNKSIGIDAPMYVIAEIGLNHGGSRDRAVEMVDAAAWAGASAIKLQTLEARTLVAESAPAPAHVQTTSLREFFATFEIDADTHRAMVARARHHGMGVLTTPLAENALTMLEPMEFDGYKIASGDVTYHALIAAAARTKRPLVISTGMSSLWEVSSALEAAREAGATDIALLHCVSAYPTPLSSQNLRAISTLASTFKVPVGLSDHGANTSAALPALALGACIYERHLVLDGDDQAIDKAVSSTPAQLKALVGAFEEARAALGDGKKVCQPAEMANLSSSRRGLYTRRAMRAGETITESDIAVVRPVSELSPWDLPLLVGRRLGRNMREGEAFEAVDVALERAS